MRPKFSQIALYLFTKYFIFYIFMMFKNNDFKIFEIDNLRQGHTLTYFIFIMLPLPIVSMILFSIPLFFLLKLRNIIYIVVSLFIFLLADYFVYVILTSRNFIDLNGFYSGVISLLFFFLFFYKYFKTTIREGL